MNVSQKNNHKRKILIFPFDLMSHYLRCIVLAKQYPNDDVLFAQSEKYDSFVKDAGYSTFKVESFDPVKVMECAAKFDFSWLNEQDIERVFRSQMNAIENLKPDIVIGDTSPTLRMASEFNAIPYVVLMNGYMSRYYKNVRSLSKTHPGYIHLSKLPLSVSNRIIKIAEKISFKLIHKPFRKLRRKYKLRSVCNYIQEMEGDENLICDHDFLFPQRKLPANYQIIGPLMYEQVNNETQLISELDPNKKTICVCMGSTGKWDKLQFLSSSKYDSYNIITAGDLQNKIQGNHIIARPFVALEKILPHCSALLCHGGNGTIYHGIENKVYILCLTDHFEQEWNVQQLEAFKLGVSINEAPKEKLDAFLNRLTC